MNKETKTQTIDQVGKLAAAAKVVVLSDYKGLTVEDATALRKNVRQAKGALKVIKNTLSRRALADAKYQKMQDQLTGQNALAFSAGDPVEMVKRLVEFAKTHPNFKIKCGVMEGAAVSGADLAEIAKLPAREVLLAQIMAAFNAPVAGLLGVLQSNVQSFLILLKGIEEQKSAGATDAAPAGQA